MADLNGAGEIIEQHAKIETLSDEILLEIFDSVRLASRASTGSDLDMRNYSGLSLTWSLREWHRVAHVCRRWRFLVFASPLRLDLRLVYTFNRKDRDMKNALSRWPTLPIAVWYPMPCINSEDENNASFALQHPNRIREINLVLTNSLLSKTRAQLLASFPALEYLRLESPDPESESPPLPVGFLGSSAPRLSHIHLTGVAFPTLPQFLLSTRDIVSLQLESVSESGYFSPEALSISLSMMTQLKSLIIEFLPSASSDIESTGQPMAVRAVLPALNKFCFAGDRAYLDDLISRLDSPILERSLNPSAFETQQLLRFTSHPSSNVIFHQSFLLLEEKVFSIKHSRASSIPLNHAVLYIVSEEINLEIVHEEINSAATLPYIFARHSLDLHAVQRIDMKSFLPRSPWLDPDDISLEMWIVFFIQLTSAKVLEVAGVFVPIIGSVLERLPLTLVQTVLPALNDLYVGTCETLRPFEHFARRRRASGSPITVHYTD